MRRERAVSITSDAVGVSAKGWTSPLPSLIAKADFSPLGPIKDRFRHGAVKMNSKSVLDDEMELQNAAVSSPQRAGIKYGLYSRNEVATNSPSPTAGITVVHSASDKHVDLEDAQLGQSTQPNWSTVAGLRKFPDEVFSIIFELYVEDLGNPWVLMHVCSRWRTAARHTRRIWSRIMITHASFHSSLRRFLGYEVCHTETLLRNALARAAGSPLDIIFSLSHRDGAEPRQSDYQLLCGLVNLLRTEKAYLRIRSLEASSMSQEWLSHITFDGFKFPLLERASLATRLADLSAHILRTAPRLQSLRMSLVAGVDWDLSKLMNITDLQLSRQRGVSRYTTFRTTSLAPCPVKLYLRMVNISNCGTLSIPTLQELVLFFSHIKSELSLPRLQVLSMIRSSIPATADHLVTLPSLTTLDIRSCTLEDQFYVTSPLLRTLSVAHSYFQVDTRLNLEAFIEQVI
ncbi:hypothetical protein FRC17_000406 [Serendipita sp. 399]|nr:hypothetical protein FRC17_000406 [Serendipita sp. 399]